VKSVKFAAAMIAAAFFVSGSVAIAADAILINFSSRHCGPCQQMRPTLAELERSGVPVRHVDVADEPDLARRFGIRSTPTFVVVSGGQEVTRLVGTASAAQLHAAIAIDPRGPLIPTGSKNPFLDPIAAPQTRLAPIASTASQPTLAPQQTFTSAAAVSAPRSEAMPSVSMADAVERAEAATVRLRVHDGNGFGVGTGTIIDVHGDEALVLTCGHLFRETQGKGKVEVDLFVGGQTRTVAGQVVDFDADSRDIALVAIRPGFEVRPVGVIGKTNPVQNGQSAFSFGCDRGADPSRRDTRITGIDKYNQHLGVSNLEIAGAPIDGRSGGGLFDNQGRLIGVCNAADYKGDVGIYAGPGSVQWQLDRVDLAHLYQSPATAASAVQQIASLGNGSAAAAAVAPQAFTPQTPAPQTLAIAAATPDSTREVIVIVRDLGRPGAQSEVMTLQNPSADLMQMIQQHAR
jgi:thiol-disulfide isomerase/thioredoxin